jgi:hypothetical protein
MHGALGWPGCQTTQSTPPPHPADMSVRAWAVRTVGVLCFGVINIKTKAGVGRRGARGVGATPGVGSWLSVSAAGVPLPQRSAQGFGWQRAGSAVTGGGRPSVAGRGGNAWVVPRAPGRGSGRSLPPAETAAAAATQACLGPRPATHA